MIRARWFLYGLLAGMVVALAIAGSITHFMMTGPVPLKTVPVVSRPDTVTVTHIIPDTTLADSLKLEISRLQQRLNYVRRPVVTKIIRDTIIQYASVNKISVPYVRGAITSWALTPVDSVKISATVDVNAVLRDQLGPKILGVRRHTWYVFGAGLLAGVIAWETIR